MSSPQLTDRDLATLLKDLKGIDNTDKEGSHDYAFLEETIFPTLLPALKQLLDNVEEKNMPPLPAAEGLPPDPSAYNPLRSLAELLIRQHPNGVFKKESIYTQHLEKVAAARREQRLQRELLILEAERKEKEEALLIEIERTEKEDKEKSEREEMRVEALAKKLADRAKASREEAEAKAGPFGNVMRLRETCMNIIAAFNFSGAQDTSQVSNLIYKETCSMLVADSNATFVGAGSLDAPGLASTQLYYHTAADKKEFEVEEDEEPAEEQEEGAEQVEKPPKAAPPPEITVRELPPREDELALVLKRGVGITFDTVIDGLLHVDEEENETREKPKRKFVADCKFTEGMFFFEEKRPGTFLAVPIFQGDEVIGVLCADTLDSILGSELQESEGALFEAAAFIMQQCLDYAEWCLLDARRESCFWRLQSLAKDPRTLPTGFAEAFVESIDLLAPGMHSAVAVFDTDTTMRLLCNKTHDGIKTQDEEVTAEDTRNHVSVLFDARGKRDIVHGHSGIEGQIMACAAPVVDVNGYVPAVLYIAADPKAKSPHEDVVDFVGQCAILAQPVLLAPAPNAMRVLSVLAAAGIGDPKELYTTSGLLCKRYTNASEVFIACTHGPGGLRVLHQVGPKMEDIVNRSDYVACDDAMRTQNSAVRSGLVAAPLCRKRKDGQAICFGVLGIQSGELSLDQHSAFEGVAAALSAALEVSEFRRRLVICSQPALVGLLKRTDDVKGVYFAFSDIGGQQVCLCISVSICGIVSCICPVFDVFFYV